MASRSYNNYGSLRPMPKPVRIDIPDYRNGSSGTRRREARPLPRFEDNGYGGMPRERSRSHGNGERGYINGERGYGNGERGYINGERGYDNGERGYINGERGYDNGLKAYEPEIRERQSYRAENPRAGMQRRRRPPPPGNPPARKRQAPRRQEAPARQGIMALAGINFSLKVNPLYRHIAIVVIGLTTIIAVGAILIANAVSDNALAVFVDNEHIGYIQLTAGWSSEAFHEEAIMELQTRRGVGVNVDQTVTLEPTRASPGDISSRDSMLSQIVHNYFTYKFSAVAIYAFNPHEGRYRREALMRSMSEVDSARYLLTQRFQTSNTVYYGFYPDWQLVPVEIDDENVNFQTPQEAFARLDRRIREYVEYTIQSGDTLIGIARAWEMELAELIRINNITAGSTIMPGQRIWVVQQAPLLSVITIEEVESVVTVPMPVNRVYVTTLQPAHTQVRQDGRDGERRVITRTTRRGTQIIDEEEIYGEYIIEAIPMIVEVGEAR